MHAATAMSRTELHDAVEDGDVEGVRLLLAKSTDQVNVRDFQGRTPAYLAAWRGKNDILSMLILEGADVNIGKNNGATPAFIAASEGFNETLRLLVSNGADVNRTKTNIEKDSPATVAALNGNIDCLRTLVQGEADMEYKNSFGKSPALYLRERHGQDLEHIMLEERRKKATQMLRQSIRFNDAEQIKARVAEARKYEVSESKLNMLGWQSALHKALTDQRAAGTSRNDSWLKVVWQWRAHGSLLQLQGAQQGLRASALLAMDAAAGRMRLLVASRGFDLWRRHAISYSALKAAQDQQTQQKRLRTALLRLNRKYAATAMLRCLEGFFVRRLLTRALGRWRYGVVVGAAREADRVAAARLALGLLARRLSGSLQREAWARWQGAVREARQHAARVGERQIELFRKKVERSRKRTATLTVYFFAQRCAAAALAQWFTHWRYGHRVAALQSHAVHAAMRRLELLRSRVVLGGAWQHWRGAATADAATESRTAAHALALSALDRLARRMAQRRLKRALRFWRLARTLPARRLAERERALSRLDGLARRLRVVAAVGQLRSNAAAAAGEQRSAETAAAKAAAAAAARAETLEVARRQAAALVVGRSRCLDRAFLGWQFNRWHRATHQVGRWLGVESCHAVTRQERKNG
jgi:hypothetical protein